MWNGLIDTGAPGIEILHAYTVKEDLRALLALAGTNPSRAEIAHQLERFYRRAASCPAPEAHRLAETIEGWWPAIEAAITTGYSNARSEGYNRLAKHVGRNAFGFRNVDTNANAYAGPAPANTGGPQSRTPSCPLKFEEPIWTAPDGARVAWFHDPDGNNLSLQS